MATGESTRVVIAAFFANLGIAIAKFVGFGFTGSSAMLAEGIHSVADTGNQALLLLGGRLAKRHPDEEFQFGYARERYFWSFVVALVLFSLGSLLPYSRVMRSSVTRKSSRTSAGPLQSWD